MYCFNASISKRTSSFLVTFCKCSCNLYVFTHFKTFVYKWKIYKLDFAHIKCCCFWLVFLSVCLSNCVHRVFKLPSLKHSNAKHSLFVPLMCDSFNSCLCMIPIVVICITEDSFFYVSASLFLQFNCFASNQGNIKLQAPNFYYNFF